MKRILVINPNTSAAVTDMVLASCRHAYPDVDWQGTTARFGAAYISGEASYAVAGHAVLDAYAAYASPCDAVLIACFGDPGLLALRDIASVPVVGLAQSSFLAAAALGPFAVVTGGAPWGPMLERFARAHQLDRGLVCIRTVDLTGAQIAAAPENAMDDLAAQCQACRDFGAASVVLGGAALVGLAHSLERRLKFPVLDNVLLGAAAVVQAASAGRMPLPPVPRTGAGMTGLSSGLALLMS